VIEEEYQVSTFGDSLWGWTRPHAKNLRYAATLGFRVTIREGFAVAEFYGRSGTYSYDGEEIDRCDPE